MNVQLLFNVGDCITNISDNLLKYYLKHSISGVRNSFFLQNIFFKKHKWALFWSMEVEGCFCPFLTFASCAVCAAGLGPRRSQAGRWLCTPTSPRLLWHTAGPFLQLLFARLPSVLGADFISAPREISLQSVFVKKIIFLL